ncbi:uncharacterized protein DDB_G0280205-like [Dendrobium catenatum]|uniref:uncharacterized protein DDB_G0280205-like n=1 Tax=Dendrobium catenatum TaxID=906689 RepID=UPI0010A04CD6|nr:uncharacterized protein DDB_G0280205-like [Dendrobium catenatum]
MASSFAYLSNFPPLPGALPPALACPVGLNFVSNLTKEDPVAEEFSLSFVPPATKVPFSADELAKGVPDWGSSLVGYSIGPRPTYLSLLNSVKKAWNPKGDVELLSLNDGFFLFKFSSPEDYQLAWSGGPWFFFGRPFILQKWTPKFKPQRDEFSSIPIWIKIVDLPLAVWNPAGISKIASFVGHPLAVDSLTARKTRLTFARVCVLVSCKSSFPDEIPVSLDGDDVSLKVLYDWKPTPCSGCGSIVHPSTLCHINPQPKTTQAPPRGRSSSRHRTPRPPPHKPPLPPPNPPNPPPLSNNPTTPTPGSLPTTIPITGLTSALTTSSPSERLLTSAPQQSLPQNQIISIPNLNSPNEEASSSSDIPPFIPPTKSVSSSPITSTTNSSALFPVTLPADPLVTSPNRFEILQPEEPPDDSSSIPTTDFASSKGMRPPSDKPTSQNVTKGKSAKKTRSSNSKSK